jgi:hypothetical protein
MSENSTPLNSDEFLLTIFLKHDQTHNLTEIGEKLGKTGFWKNFPRRALKLPPGM